MNRKEVENILDNANTLDYGSQSGYECGMINNLIDNIYDEFEKDLKDINNQISRLKKQLSKDHHIECSYSFCKPVDNQLKEDLEDYNKIVKVGINAN